MTPLEQIRDEVLASLTDVGVMLIIFVAGIAVALIVRKILVRILRAVRFNDLAYNIGFTTVLFKANIHHTPAVLVANIVYGLLLLTTLLIGLSALNLPQTADVIAAVFLWIPQLVLATILLIAGYLLSKFIGRSVLLTAVNAEVRSARLISYAVQALIMIFTVAVSLEQIGLAKTTIVAAFSILFGGLVLALSIAFGLGGRDLAKDFLERQMKRREEDYKEQHPFSHL
jgi:hypothetical protein